LATYRVDACAELQQEHDQNRDVDPFVVGLDVHLGEGEVEGDRGAHEEGEEPEDQEDRNLRETCCSQHTFFFFFFFFVVVVQRKRERERERGRGVQGALTFSFRLPLYPVHNRTGSANSHKNRTAVRISSGSLTLRPDPYCSFLGGKGKAPGQRPCEPFWGGEGGRGEGLTLYTMMKTTEKNHAGDR